MQTSKDTSDKDGWREDYGQPFVIPSPGSGGTSTLIHEPHLAKGGDVNDDEVEDLRPLFDYGETEKEEEEEPLRRQTRRMTMDQLLEVVESLKTQGEEGTVVQRPRTVRRLVDEEEPEEPQIQEAGEEREVAEGNLAREEREKKRKGKGNVLPTTKRSRPANTGVVGEDVSAPASPRPEDEGSDSAGQELRWTRTFRGQQGRPATSPQHVLLTPALRQQMSEFDDPKMQKEVHQRVTSQKKLKAGNMLHLPSLEKIEMNERFAADRAYFMHRFMGEIHAT